MPEVVDPDRLNRWVADTLNMEGAVSGRVVTLVDNLTELRKAAWALSTYAASINWDGSRNQSDWLEGLRERIEAVQALCPDGGRSMTVNADAVSHAIHQAKEHEESKWGRE